MLRTTMWMFPGILSLCLFSGCGSQETEVVDSILFDRTKAQVNANLVSLQERERPELEPLVSSVRRILKKFDSHGKRAITEVPEPYSIGVSKGEFGERESFILVIHWVERCSDIAAITIREYWFSGKTVSESYKMHPKAKVFFKELGHESWSHVMALRVKERISPDIQMDAEEWKKWMENKDDVDQPPIFIAKPSNNVHVLISLIDEIGHESPAVPLDVWVEE